MNEIDQRISDLKKLLKVADVNQSIEIEKILLGYYQLQYNTKQPYMVISEIIGDMRSYLIMATNN